MNLLRSLFSGMITAAISLVMVVGGISLALTEGFTVAPTPKTASLTPPITVVTLPVPTGQPTVLATVTQQQMVFITATAPLATSCPVPPGWVRYVVQPGDTLLNLATSHKLTTQDLQEANCLTTTSLMPGWEIFLPASPPTATASLLPTSTPVPCGPPYGWVRYVIQPGDTLTRLSLAYNISVYQLMVANCLSGPFIRSGDILWVPNVPPRWPTSTATQPLPTAIPPTKTPVTPVATDTATVPVPPTATFTPTSTGTIVPSETATTAPTPTVTHTAIPTETVTVVSAAATATSEPIPTDTPIPSATVKK